MLTRQQVYFQAMRGARTWAGSVLIALTPECLPQLRIMGVKHMWQKWIWDLFKSPAGRGRLRKTWAGTGGSSLPARRRTALRTALRLTTTQASLPALRLGAMFWAGSVSIAQTRIRAARFPTA